MATKEEIQNARQLIDLDVKEVSMVDRPANLREFLVVKRLQSQTEDSTMGAFEQSYGIDPSSIGLNISKAEGVDVEKAALDDKQKEALKAVVEWMKKMSKGPGAPTSEIGVAAKILGSLAAGQAVGKATGTEDKDMADKEKKQEEMSPEEEEKKKAAPKPEDEEEMKGKEAKEKAKAKPGEGEDEYPSPKMKKTQKNADGEDVPLALAIDADGGVYIQGTEIAKARSFTGARTNAVKEAASALLKLLGEVDEEAAKSVVHAFKELPKGGKVDSQVRPTTPTQKSIEDENAELKSQLSEVTKRLEAIEKTRQPSKSVDDDGGTEKKVEKSFWSGVL